MNTIKDLTALIGNTPVLDITDYYGAPANIFAKLEMYNPLASVKDRIAFAMIDEAEKAGRIKPGDTLIEPTSGNTGIGLAFVAASRGYKLILTMPATMSAERRVLLKALGARVVLTDPEGAMTAASEKARELAAEIPGAVILGQFENPANPEVHRKTTAREILSDLDGKIDIFAAGVGTGGTLTGVGEVLKKANPAVKIVAIEPFQSSVLSGKGAALHRIQGIGAGFVPAVLNTEIIDEIIRVKDDDAGDMARDAARKKGLLVGISSGAALWAALELAKRPENAGKNIVTILPDSGERYLSTWLYEAFDASGEGAGPFSGAAEKALYLFSNGFSCSEAVLKALNETYDLGLTADDYRIASGFGAGMGESGCACGAVVACTMAFGLAAGRKNVHESNRLVFLAANELQKRFKDLHKAVCCRALTASVEWKSAEQKTLCDRYVENAVKIADEIISGQLFAARA